MKWLVAVAVLLPVTTAYADDDPFAVMRDMKQSWTYEVVNGTSLSSLKLVKGAPVVECHLDEVVKVDDLPRARFQCDPPDGTRSDGLFGLTISQHHVLLFEAGEMREIFFGINTAESIHKQTNVHALTFPTTFKNTWKIDFKSPVEGHTLLTVTSKTQPVLGKPRIVWASDYQGWDPPATGAPILHAAAVYAPGVGPVEMCDFEKEKGKGSSWWCLRLTKMTPAP